VAHIRIFEALCCQSAAGDDCCGPVSAGEQLARFLRSRPGPPHEIEVVDVSDPARLARLPREFAPLLSAGPAAMPALAVNERVVHTGGLPNWLDVLSLVEHAARADDAGAVAKD